MVLALKLRLIRTLDPGNLITVIQTDREHRHLTICK
jgi:hypothetical protein